MINLYKLVFFDVSVWEENNNLRHWLITRNNNYLEANKFYIILIIIIKLLSNVGNRVDVSIF